MCASLLYGVCLVKDVDEEGQFGGGRVFPCFRDEGSDVFPVVGDELASGFAFGPFCYLVFHQVLFKGCTDVPMYMDVAWFILRAIVYGCRILEFMFHE